MKKYASAGGLILFLYLYFSVLFTFITCFPNFIIYAVWFFIPFLLIGIYTFKNVLPRQNFIAAYTQVLLIVNLWYLLYTVVIFPLLAWPGWADNFLEGNNCPYQQGLFINSFIPVYVLFIFFPSVVLLMLLVFIHPLIYRSKINILHVLKAAGEDLLHNIYTFLRRRMTIFIIGLAMGVLLPYELNGVYDHIKFDVKDSIYNEAIKNEGLTSSPFYFRDLWGDYFFTDTFHFRREIIPGSGIYYFDSLPYRQEQQDVFQIFGIDENISIYPDPCYNNYYSHYYTNGADVFYKNRWLSNANEQIFEIICGGVTLIYPQGETFRSSIPFATSGSNVYYRDTLIKNVSGIGLQYIGDGIWQNSEGRFQLILRYTTEGSLPMEVIWMQ